MSAELIIARQTNRQHYPVLATQQLIYVLIDVKPGQSLARVQMPLNFSLVLDRSGSMAGEKMHFLRQAAKLAIDQMTAQDHVSIIVFNEKAQMVAGSQPVSDPQRLKQEIDRIRDGGGTTMSTGMAMGLQELRKQVGGGRISRMLLLTDGQTYGDEAQCQELGRAAGAEDIAISALGLGDDWNDKLLDAVAHGSGRDGRADLIEQPDAIIPVFQQTVQQMQGTVITNARLTLRLIAGMVPRQVWQSLPIISNLGYAPLSERDVQVDLGNLDKDTGKQILVELVVPPRQPGNYRIAQAEVSYDVPSAGLTNQRERVDIVVGFTADQALSSPVNPAVMNIVERVTAFRLQTQALQAVDAGDLQAATTKLRAAATRLLNMGEDALATTFLQEAANLENSRPMSAAGTKQLRYKTQKLTQKLEP